MTKSQAQAAKDQQWMRECVRLALRGMGLVSPNPMVGCVIVKNGRVIATGCHKKYGGEHAEQIALRALSKKQKNKKTKKQFIGATVFLNLEPCCHWGKTPPCVDVLITAGVKRVVVGMKDPNPLVNGKSIRKLRRAGIKVDVGVLTDECQEINEPFTKWITTRRPFVLLKCALTVDGALTLKKGTATPLGCPETMRRTHQLRQQYDAIAVGVDTVLIDNPLLTCRLGTKRKRNPARVVFDTRLRISENARMFPESGQTIIFTGPRINNQKKTRLEKKYPAVMVVSLPLGRDQHLSLKAALKWLGDYGISSLLVEGGAGLANNLLKQRLADKVMLIITPHLAADLAAPRLIPALAAPAGGQSSWGWSGGGAWFTIYPN